MSDDDERVPAADAWLRAQALDQCDGGPCGDDPDCPCKDREEKL